MAVVAALVVGLAGCTGTRPAARVDTGARDSRLTITPGERLLFADQLLVYGFHGFAATDLAAIRRQVSGVTPVVVAEVAVASGRPSYPIVPVETMSADPQAYAVAAGRPEIASAFAAGAVLSETEGSLRRLRAGGRLRLADGRVVPVAAVVDDHVLGGNEMALPASFMPKAADAATYLLVDDGGDAAGTAARVRAALPTRALRVRTQTDNGFLSADDTVLTQAQIKKRFGEFALRPRSDGRGFVPDDRWEHQWLATQEHVPQLGAVTCNREVLPALVAAMREVTGDGLGSTVHTADYQVEGGCWNPSVVPFSGGSISRHAWGIAVDINVDANDLGTLPRQDPRLVAIMRKHGFAWGGDWLRPDGMHFEYVGANPTRTPTLAPGAANGAPR